MKEKKKKNSREATNLIIYKHLIQNKNGQDQILIK